MTLEGLVVNRYPTRRTVMTVGTLKNWVWCEKCLEYKDASEVCFIGIEEDGYGKDVLHFICDKCDLENINNIISSASRPRGQ